MTRDELEKATRTARRLEWKRGGLDVGERKLVQAIHGEAPSINVQLKMFGQDRPIQIRNSRDCYLWSQKFAEWAQEMAESMAALANWLEPEETMRALAKEKGVEFDDEVPF